MQCNNTTKRKEKVNGMAQEKGAKVIEVKMQKDNANMNLPMTPECKERWQKFMEGKGYSFVHVSAALSLYMDMYNAGDITVRAVL